MVVLGLDVSTRMGYAVTYSWGHARKEGVFHHPVDRDTYRYARYNKYEKDVAALIDTTNPVLIVTETLVASKFGGSLVVAELGTLVRALAHGVCGAWALTQGPNGPGVPVLEVPPSTLKKFVTGRGNAAKNEMLLHVYKRWGREYSDDNMADAYALSMLGWDIIREKITRKADQPMLKKLLGANPHIDWTSIREHVQCT